MTRRFFNKGLYYIRGYVRFSRLRVGPSWADACNRLLLVNKQKNFVLKAVKRKVQAYTGSRCLEEETLIFPFKMCIVRC